MNENFVSGEILDCCVQIHKVLGPGLFESVYEEVLAFELINRGLHLRRQVPIPVIWKEVKLDQGFRADLIVENKVVVEIKSIDSIAQVHKKQLLTYLRLVDIRVGLLVNFNEALLKDGVTRIVNGY
jgi:GxxExxY protein